MDSLIELHTLPDRKQQEEIELSPNGTSLDLLQAVYRNSALDLHVRMRAAGMAIPFETPKLLATAIVSEGNFADLLDRRLKRMEQQKLIDAKLIKENGGNADARLPPPIPDRRFRRF